MKALLSLILLPQSVHAAGYTFTRVADRVSTGATSLDGASINNNGSVAFRATFPGSGGLRDIRNVIFISSGGTLTPVADTDGELMFLEPPAINSNAAVAFAATLDNGGKGIYSVSGGSRSVVYSATGDFPLGSGVHLNDGGVIVFRAGSQLVLASGSSSRTIADTAVAPFTGLMLSDSGQINTRGTVAFSGTGRVFVDNGGNISTAAADSGPLTSFSLVTPTINDEGVIAFSAAPAGRPNSLGVYTLAAGRLVRVSGPEMESVRANRISINSAGAVAFGADVGRSGPTFIQVGAEKLIAVGDALFGGRVRSLGIGLSGLFLNAGGEVVFEYVLQDGSNGIALAKPSELNPGTGIRPVLPASAVVNAASLDRTGAPAPGSVVSLFGDNLSDRLLVAGPSLLPTVLGDVSVTFSGIPAPLFFVSPGQINAQVPYELQGGATVEVIVRNGYGQSETRSLAVAQHSPAVYTLNQAGSGQGIVVFANSATLVAPRGVTADSRPARPGDIVTIYANGLGLVTPPIANGSNSCQGVCVPDLSNLTLRHVITPPAIVLGGVKVPPDRILFAGLAPQFVGLYQINMTLPEDAPHGNAVSLIIDQGGVPSRSDVTIAIEAAP